MTSPSFGETQLAGHGARRLGEGVHTEAGATTAHRRCPTSVEEPQAKAVAAKDLDQGVLSLVKGPLGGDIASRFIAVGVAQHDLLDVAAAGEPAAPFGEPEQSVHELGGALEVVDGFEQGNDLDLEAPASRFEQPGFT